jgi:two-component system repressor protein LuxO
VVGTRDPDEAIRVLLVEDNVDHALLAQNGLPSDLGFDVTHVRTGAEAIDAVRQEGYDVYLLDYRLPDREGIEVCREIRDHAAEAVILLVTAVDREALVREAFEAGADDYVVKGPSFMDRIADEVLTNLEAPA